MAAATVADIDGANSPANPPWTAVPGEIRGGHRPTEVFVISIASRGGAASSSYGHSLSGGIDDQDGLPIAPGFQPEVVPRS